MDTLTPAQRRKAMQHVKSKDTSIELKLRKALWAKGIRYRKNYPMIPGKPDIVLTKYKIAIFCDSEFWHGKNWSSLKKQLQRGNNPNYWIKKIQRTIDRDTKNDILLRSQGWTVIRFWGKEIIDHTNDCVDLVEDAILSQIVHNRIDMQPAIDCSDNELRG